jgi:hypothetical protein
LKESLGWVSVGALAVQLHFGFWGHVARHDEGTALGIIRKWRDHAWRMVNRALPRSSRVCFLRTGTQTHYDTHLVQASENWQSLATNRAEWNILKQKAAANIIPSYMFCGSAGPLQCFGNKFRDWTFGRRLVGYLPPLCFISDNEALVLAARGHPVALDYRPYSEFLRWSLHALHIWGFRPLCGADSLIVHRKREDNTLADMLANVAVSSAWSAIHSCIAVVPGDALVLSSDGACKGCPGRAGSAAALSLYRNGLSTVLATAGVNLPHSISAIAEFEAACLAIHLLISWLISAGVAV